ncbi:MAG: InlB B-repeat-containing protein [Clostridia bacterium]|nr:InlB B-repeat-containing protein [Clostridia bacterium]
MKKFMLLIVALCGVMVFSACGGGGTSNESGGIPTHSSGQVQDKKCTVTFKQLGQNDIVKEVKEGETLTDIPTPAEKVGYDVVWDTNSFANITENMVVTAVETAKKYTVTYDAGEGTVTSATQEVTFDSEPTLATPTREGYVFTGWTYEGKAVTGKWTIAQSVTLVATWEEETKYTVIFKQAGQADKSFEVAEDGLFDKTNIPAPIAKTGYTIVWKAEDLAKLDSAITGPVVINAVETAKTYTVTLKLDGGTLGDATGETTVEVTYDEAYDLTPTKAEDDQYTYTFAGWKYGETTLTATGTWNIDAETIELTAVWTKTAKPSVNDDENWTKNY